MVHTFQTSVEGNHFFFIILHVFNFSNCNTFSLFILGLMFRLLGGEPLIHLPAAIEYPWYDPVNKVQRFPFRTLSMIISFLVVIIVSLITKFIFENEYLPKHMDYFECVVNIPEDVVVIDEPYENGNGEMTMINLKKKKAELEPNGINPSLKISKAEILEADEAPPLLDPGTGPQVNPALEVSPNTEVAPPVPPPSYSQITKK